MSPSKTLMTGVFASRLAGEDRSICTTVSSHHLIEDKWRQLHTALDKAESE